jgi:predicted ArsR family transcriptional regulator
MGRKRREGRKPYFFEVFTGFVDSGIRQLERSETHAYLILLRETKPDGLARVSHGSIAERGGMSRRQAITAVQSLIKRGVVEVVARGSGGAGPSIYCLMPGGIETFRREHDLAATLPERVREPMSEEPPKRKAGGKPHFFEVFNGLVDSGIRYLHRSETHAYLVLLRDTKPDGLARVSFGDIATRCGISRRQAIRAVKELVERGVVEVVRRGGRDIGTSTYRIVPGGRGPFQKEHDLIAAIPGSNELGAIGCNRFGYKRRL